MIVLVTESTGFESKRVVHELGSWRLACFEDIQSTTQNEGWQSFLLEVSRNQTHGLVTDGSQWDQQQNIGFLKRECRLKVRDEFGCDAFL